MFRPRYSCVGRAKQLWLTTPFAMKSPVLVVMSYIGMSMPRSSIRTTRRSTLDLNATSSIVRLRVVVGSVVRKKRTCSANPPAIRIERTPLWRAGSRTAANPNPSAAGPSSRSGSRRRNLRFGGSLCCSSLRRRKCHREIRATSPWLSARAKRRVRESIGPMPPRTCESRSWLAGGLSRPRTRRGVVAMPTSARYRRVRSSGSESASASRKRWTVPSVRPARW